MEMRSQLYAPATLPQGKGPQYLLGRRLDGPQSWSGHGGKEKKSHHCPHQELKADFPACSLSILAELPWLLISEL